MDMLSDVAHTIVVTSYMITSSDVAHTIMVTSIACARSYYASIYDVTMITRSTSDDVLILVVII
jgi:hypothetical protein